VNERAEVNDHDVGTLLNSRVSAILLISCHLALASGCFNQNIPGFSRNSLG
jgi:hypothetical protein